MDSVSIMLDTFLSLSWGVDVNCLLILYNVGTLCHSFMVQQQVELTVGHYTFTIAKLAVSGNTEILSQTLGSDYIFIWWSPKKISLHVKRLICCKARYLCRWTGFIIVTVRLEEWNSFCVSDCNSLCSCCLLRFLSVSFLLTSGHTRNAAENLTRYKH
jgi:hypothetical protein